MVGSWDGEWLVRVVGVGELCLDSSVFAKATTDKTADKRCWMLVRWREA